MAAYLVTNTYSDVIEKHKTKFSTSQLKKILLSSNHNQNNVSPSVI